MQWKKAMAILLTVVLAFSVLTLPTDKALAAEDGMVRVYLSSMNYYGMISDVTITLNGSYAVESRPEITLSNRGSYYIQLMNGTIYLSGDGIDTPIDMGSSFTIKQYTDESGKIGTMSFYNNRYGTRSYRGDMKFDINSGGLRLINTVYIEDYLYGVLAGELSNTFPLETLKAQAVIARSYVYNRMISNQPNYEINDTSSDQVYKGYNSSNDQIMRAVDETAGVLLKYGSSYVNAYFGASNGGQIELPRNAWGSSAESLGCYVMKDDPYDLRNPSSRMGYYTFDASLTNIYSEFYNLIQQKLYSATGSWVTPSYVNSVTLEDPIAIDPASVGVSRNYQTMRMNVQHSDGYSTDILIDLHNELKYMLFGGDSDLRLFGLAQNGSNYTLTLGRYGHGVGMSQRGAQQMATEGFGYRDIIQFYFEGVTLDQKTFTRDETTNNATNTSKPIIATGTVNASSLNVRADASSSGSRLGSLGRGAKVSITENLGEWYQIVYGSNYGYVSAAYILLDNSGTTNDTTQPDTGSDESIGTGVVTLSLNSSTLNMRSAASSSASVLTRLANGTQLTVYEKTANNWYRVKTAGGLAGYVSCDYVTFTANTDDTTTPGTSNDNNSDTTNDNTSDNTNSSTQTFTGKVSLSKSTSTLNVRSSNSTSSTSLGKLKHGDTVTILAQNAGWYKIQYGTGVGYVSMGYITDVTSNTTGGADTEDNTDATTPNTPDSSETPTEGTLGGLEDADIPEGGVRGAVKTSDGTTLTIYSDASKTTALGYLSNGSGVTVIGVLDDLYFVRSDAGTKGFVYKQYILTATGNQSDGSNTGGSDTSNDNATSTTYTKGSIKLSSASSSLRLRKEASTSSQILTTMPHGSEIEIIGTSGDWYNIIYQDYKGYILKSYVKVEDSTSENAGSSDATGSNEGSSDATTGTKVYIANITLSSAGSRVNVRSGPGSSYDVIGGFQHGEKVYVLASNGDWYKLVYGNTSGYVLKSYIRLTGDTGTLSSSGSVTQDAPSSSGSNQTQNSGSTGVTKSGIISLSSSSSKVNVRAGAGTNYDVAFTAKHGTVVTITSDNGDWYGVEIDGKSGFVSANYVKLNADSSSSDRITATTTASVNLRASGSASADRLGTYSKGTTVTVLAKGDEWSMVQVGTKTGYMKNTYLNFA